MKYMFGGTATLPLTITTAGGAGLSAAAQHSQSLEALLCHIPGLKVVYPSNPYDMKGLMTACIREDNPTVMVKHKRLLGMTGHRAGGAATRSRSARPTIAARRAPTSPSSPTAGWSTRPLAAAETLAAEGIECEVIDPRTLQPLDIDTIVESVARDQPRRRGPRGRAVRRSRRRDRRADPGGGVRLPRRAGRPASARRSRRCRSARSLEQHYVPDAERHRRRHPRRPRPTAGRR